MDEFELLGRARQAARIAWREGFTETYRALTKISEAIEREAGIRSDHVLGDTLHNRVEDLTDS